MITYHIGIDLHKSLVQVCVLDARGERHEERRFSIPTMESTVPFLEWLRTYAGEAQMAVEALGCNRWFVNTCRERGWDVLVVNASKLNLRQEGKKTDRRDAFEIARRLFLGDLHRCAKTHYSPDAEYGRRKVMRVAQSQVLKRTETISQIRGLLNAYKVVPPCRTLWSRKGIAWLEAVRLPTEDLTFSLQVLVDDLVSVQRRLGTLRQRIREMAAKDEEAQLWMATLPSVGAQTALMVRAELGDVTRFDSADAVASYAGVVPRVTASADKAHHGAMTHRGNAHLRWIVGQWAVRLLCKEELVKKWAQPMYRRMNKNKIRVALARRLLVGLWVTCSRGEVFSLARCLGQPA